MNFYIYLLYSESSDKYYVGYSYNPLKRLSEHNNSEHLTYTSKHRPWQLKAIFLVGSNEAEAIKIERFIKQQKSRKLLEKLIDPEFQPTGFLAQLVRVPYVRD
jgi:putative endonuclease